jgi:hypothetical protein
VKKNARVHRPTNSSAPSPWKCLGSSATNPAVPQQKPQSGGIVLAVICWARAPRGGVTRQGVALTDLQSLLDCKIVNKTSLSLSLSHVLQLTVGRAGRARRSALQWHEAAGASRAPALAATGPPLRRPCLRGWKPTTAGAGSNRKG